MVWQPEADLLAAAAARRKKEGDGACLGRRRLSFAEDTPVGSKSAASLFEKVALRGKRADDLLGLRVVLDGHREYGEAAGGL